jgi:signal transduction histidine kinase
MEPLIVIILQDITLQVRKNELENINQYKVKMLSSIQHELRTPLNCSINLLQILQEKISVDYQNDYVIPAIVSNKNLL